VTGYNDLLRRGDSQDTYTTRGIIGLGEDVGVAKHPVATPPSGIMKGKKIRNVACGIKHSIFVDVDGNVYATGSNALGALGLSKESSVNEFVPVQIVALGNVKIRDIAAGAVHSLFLDEGGRVYSSGWGLHGALGTGNTQNVYEPTLISQNGDLNGHPVDQIAASSNTTILLDMQGRVYLTGTFKNGTDSIYFVPTLFPASGDMAGRRIVKVSPGSYHVLFLDSEGLVWVMGEAPYGQNGEGTARTIHIPEQVKALSAPPHSKFKTIDVKAGASQSLFLMEDGSVKVAGKVSQGHDWVLGVQDLNETPFAPFLNTKPTDGKRICTNYSAIETAYLTSFFMCSHEFDFDDPPVNIYLPLLIGISSVAGVTFLCCMGICVALVPIVALCWRQYKGRKRAKRETSLAMSLLQGFEADTELDALDADVNRAKLMIRQSLLEIDFNELKVERKLGSGGSESIVFLALWNQMHVAMKVFNVRRLTGERHYEEFQHELSLMAGLRHPRLVGCFGASLQYPRIGIVMEYCEGGTLTGLIEHYCDRKPQDDAAPQNPSRSLPVQCVLRLLTEICEGMQFLHSRGVIHRDLKCENILLTSEDASTAAVKISDFGLARHIEKVEQVTHMTSNIGTNIFIAPEVTNGDIYNAKCDVYSFALIAFQLCCCTLKPYGNMAPMRAHILSAHDANFRPDISQVEQREEYAHLAPTIVKCWSHDPEERPDFDTLLGVMKVSAAQVRKE